MDLRQREFHAESIAVEARIATEETYEENLADFRNRNYTYIPLPDSGQFYNVKEGWLRHIGEDQWIEPETHLLDVLELLQDQQFLLYEGNDNGDDFWIINVADLNRRGVREMLYPPIAELASIIASRIRDHHDDPEELIRKYSGNAISSATIGAWYRSTEEDVELHLAEYMNLNEMQQVLSEGRQSLIRSCGFEGKEEITELREIKKLRNRVMHANRSLIRSRRDIQELLDNIERVQELIRKATGGR